MAVANTLAFYDAAAIDVGKNFTAEGALFTTLHFRRHDIQHNYTQHNDTQHNDTQHNDTQHNDTQHKDTQRTGLICETHHNDIQHKWHSA
jgi:hypothetical protein